MERRENPRQPPSKWRKLLHLIKSTLAFRPVDVGGLSDDHEVLINRPPQKEASSVLLNIKDSRSPSTVEIEQGNGLGKVIVVSEDITNVQEVHDIPLDQPKPGKMSKEKGVEHKR